jgi:hypothetical protein
MSLQLYIQPLPVDTTEMTIEQRRERLKELQQMMDKARTAAEWIPLHYEYQYLELPLLGTRY